MSDCLLSKYGIPTLSSSLDSLNVDGENEDSEGGVRTYVQVKAMK